MLFVNSINILSESVCLIFARNLVVHIMTHFEESLSYFFKRKRVFLTNVLIDYFLFLDWPCVFSMMDYAFVGFIEFDECILDWALRNAGTDFVAIRMGL